MSRLPAVLAATFLFATPMLGGCHAKFKRHAPALGEVKTKVYGVRTPTVELGGGDMYANDNIIEDVVSIYQMGKEAEIERRMIQAVDTDSVQWALEDGVANALGDGPPFAWSGEKGRGNVLQLEVREFGVRVGSLGAQGNFTYLVKMRIYTEQANRVYKASIRCDAPVGDPNVFARAYGGVNNVRQIKDMSDGEIQGAFEAMAKHCGDRIVAKMRRHAG